jgi:hypothetical protein
MSCAPTFRACGWLVLAAASCTTVADGPPGVDRAGVGSPGLALFATLPAGPGAAEVTIRPRAEEVAAGGPAALAVSPSGVVAIADLLADRVVRLAPDGAALTPLVTPAPEHVAFDAAGRLHVFSRRDGRVVAFDAGGQEVDAFDLPSTARWVTGLWPWPDGSVGVATAYQESAPLAAGRLHDALREGFPAPDGARLRTRRSGGAAFLERLADVAQDDPERRVAVLRRDPVDAPTRTGSLALVGVDADGVALLDRHDVVREAPLRVERRLVRLGPDGAPRGETLLPPVGVPVAHAVALGPDGAAWVLRCHEDRAEVWTWPAGGAP